MLVMVVFFIAFRWIHLSTPLIRLRSEERFSRNAETDLVCRLLLEKKKSGIAHALLIGGPGWPNSTPHGGQGRFSVCNWLIEVTYIARPWLYCVTSHPHPA